MIFTRLRGAAPVPFGLPELSWFPFLEPSIRIEEYLEDDTYVVRAELPGVDPAKDIELGYYDGTLRLSVARTEVHKEKGRSEFHYGSFHRTIVLPPGARQDTVTAKYTGGILEISVLVGEPVPLGKNIPIAMEEHPTSAKIAA